jgi:hypothetical protein
MDNNTTQELQRLVDVVRAYLSAEHHKMKLMFQYPEDYLRVFEDDEVAYFEELNGKREFIALFTELSMHMFSMVLAGASVEDALAMTMKNADRSGDIKVSKGVRAYCDEILDKYLSIDDLHN